MDYIRSSNCASLTKLCTSPQMPQSRRYEVNVRLAIGGTLCDLGRSGLVKLLGALNVPPPVHEEKYRQTQEFILDYTEKAQEQSMLAAVSAAIGEAGGAQMEPVPSMWWCTRFNS